MPLRDDLRSGPSFNEAADWQAYTKTRLTDAQKSEYQGILDGTRQQHDSAAAHLAAGRDGAIKKQFQKTGSAGIEPSPTPPRGAQRRLTPADALALATRQVDARIAAALGAIQEEGNRKAEAYLRSVYEAQKGNKDRER